MSEANTFPPLALARRLVTVGACALALAGCSDLVGTDEGPCGIQLSTWLLRTVNGEELPFYSVYVDDDNYSAVTYGQYWFGLDFDDDTEDAPNQWRSWLTNRQVVDGESDLNRIERSGTFTCTDGLLRLTNYETGATGTATLDGDRLIISGSGFEYVFENESN